MKHYKYGNQDSPIVLIQLVDNHDLAVIENEAAEIYRLTNTSFQLLAIKVNSWNHDLSPWKSPAVFGNEPFGDGAADTLTEVLQYTADHSKEYFIGGYSLAGLFALWAAYQTDLFTGVAAASPSIWFPGFVDHMKAGKINSDRVYLSLGNREAKTRNPVMATVADCIEISFDLLRKQGVMSMLEWNEGNHFKDADIRTAKAFSWVLNGPGGRG